MPKVSVLMPVYNDLAFLKDAMESILSQKFGDFEFIIVDDGSIDGCLALLSEYAKKDNRIQLVRNEKNIGTTASLNRGLKLCRGTYVVRMDADDISIKSRIEKQVAIMDKNPQISVLGSAVSYIDALGKDLGVTRQCALGGANLRRTPLIHSTVIIRKDHLDQYGLHYNENYRYAQDYFLWLQISKIGTIAATNDILVKYRISKEAARVEKLKDVLWATLKIKLTAIFILKIKPKLKDIVRIILEFVLLCLPKHLVLLIYLKMMFKKGVRVNL